MNDKLNRFTQQLGDNAPLAPDLENQTFAAVTEVRGPATGLRVGIALGVVAALAVGLVVVNRDDSPTAVVPANELDAEQSADGVATISKAVASVLPEGFKISERQRAVIHLTYWEDLTTGDIASLLGLSVRTIERELTLARRRLEALLS